MKGAFERVAVAGRLTLALAARRIVTESEWTSGPVPMSLVHGPVKE